METKIAIVDTEVKNLGKRFHDFVAEVRTLRGTWVGMTIAFITMLSGIVSYTLIGFNDVTDTQKLLITEQTEIKRDIKLIRTELNKINRLVEIQAKSDGKQ
jgi:hypothetical protein